MAEKIPTPCETAGCTGKAGRLGYCEKCRKAKWAKAHPRWICNPEGTRGQRQRHYAKHKDEIREKGREYREKNREQLRVKKRADYWANRELYLKRIRENKLKNFPDTLREELYFHQNGKCAICQVDLVLVGGKIDSLHRDHDHVTGVARGLLCGACNTAIGFYERAQKPNGLVIAVYEQYFVLTPVMQLSRSIVKVLQEV